MRPSVFEAAGGADAFHRLAAAHHAGCLADELLEHPFSHGVKPDHVERLATYWAEVLGGPTTYTERYGAHSAMVTPHAECEAPPEMEERFVAVFLAAIDGAQLPDDADLREALAAYIRWASADVMTYSPKGSIVPAAMAVPRWSWDGLVSS